VHPFSWLLLGTFALVAGYGLLCAYRVVRAMILDVLLLIILAGAALGAGYLFG
jgi:hypothetical protein